MTLNNECDASTSLDAIQFEAFDVELRGSRQPRSSIALTMLAD